MTFVWILLGVVAALPLLFVLGWLNALRASRVRNRKLDQLVRPAISAVLENRPSAQDLVTELAEAPATRNHLFTRLTEMGRADLFPAGCRSLEKVAESDLARWLMHANELGAAPAEMELVRFRTGPTHWAAKLGWMAGVAGPYWDNDGVPGFATGTFSELKPFDLLTAEEHVNLLREALKKRGLVVRS